MLTQVENILTKSQIFNGQKSRTCVLSTINYGLNRKNVLSSYYLFPVTVYPLLPGSSVNPVLLYSSVLELNKIS